MLLENTITHLKFVRKKPLVMVRVINGFFRKLILRQKILLRTIDWAMLYECNFRCPFCSQANLISRKRKYLTLEQIKNVWKQAQKLGVIHVNITGGEPTLIPIEKLCKIIKNFEPRRFLVSLVTNGFLLTEEKIKRLKEAGLDTLQLSLESIDEEEHDKIRCFKGSYKKIIQSLHYAKKYGLNVCLSVTVTHQNINKIHELANFAKKYNEFLLLNPMTIFGAGKTEQRLTKEDKEKYEKLLKIHWVRSDTLFNFHGRVACPGGMERIHITAYGDVITCPLVHVSYGNVLKEPLKKILEKMQSYEHIREIKPYCKQAFDDKYIEKICIPSTRKKEVPVPIEKIIKK